MEDETYYKLRLVAIIVTIILIISTCALIILKKVNNKGIKSSSTTITTQSKKEDSMSDIQTYSSTITKSTDNLENIIVYDNTVKKIDFYATKKCSKTGDKINLNSNGYKVNYSCTKQINKYDWEIKGKIDDSIEFVYTTNDKINNDYYRINSYIVKIESSSNYNTAKMIIYDSKTGDELYRISNIITPYTYDVSLNKYSSNIFIKKGIMYYHEAKDIKVDETLYDNVSDKCSINKIDFNNNINIENIRDYACDYISGN